VPFIQECQAKGYQFKLCYIWLPNVEVAIERVTARVRAGSHSIPEEAIRRRYESGRVNFWQLYAPLADHWIVFNNSGDEAIVVAEGRQGTALEVLQPQVWRQIIT